MVINRIINNPIDSNSFVISLSENSDCIVVDPGTPDCFELLQFIEKQKLNPVYIFLTHEHFDHIWGVNILKEHYACKIICSQNCAIKIIDKKKNMSVFYDQIGFQSLPADIIIENIDFTMEWNSHIFEFIVTQGHTEGSICIAVDNNILFTGDTIIKDLKTVVKFPSGNKGDLHKSLNLIFSKYQVGSVRVFPGHGECFYLHEIAIEQLT